MIDELNPTPAKPKEPHKIGDRPKNKVRILRPFLIDDTRVDKGDTAYVTDEHVKNHGHIFEKLALIAFLLSAFAFSSLAQSYSANWVPPWDTTTSTNNPEYTTNDPAWSTNLVLYPVATGNIAGGVPATNKVAAGTTVNPFLATPVGLSRYDQVAVQISAITTNLGGGWTNVIKLCPSLNGYNIDTNDPVATLTLANTTTTNSLLITNLTSSILGSIGNLQATWQVIGTNSATNCIIQFFVKPQRSG